MKPKIKVALAGFGTAGRLFHAPFITANEDYELTAVYERSRDEARKLYPQVKRVTSYEELLTLPCDLIVICVPNRLHYEYTKQALLAGKNVLCDKPFCISSAEAEELWQLAKERRLLLSVYQNRRYDSPILTLKRILAEGKLGRIVDLSLSMERFQKQRNKKEWKSLVDGTTGILYDLGIHLLDGAYHLFGMPKGVYCELKTLHPFNTVCDRMEILLSYPDGLTVRLHASQCACAPCDALVCHGTEGSYIKKSADAQESLLIQGLSPVDSAWRGESPEEWGLLTDQEGCSLPYPTVDGDYGAFYRELSCAFAGGPLPVSGEEAVKVLRIMEAALQSDLEKRMIRL